MLTAHNRRHRTKPRRDRTMPTATVSIGSLATFTSAYLAPAVGVESRRHRCLCRQLPYHHRHRFTVGKPLRMTAAQVLTNQRVPCGTAMPRPNHRHSCVPESAQWAPRVIYADGWALGIDSCALGRAQFVPCVLYADGQAVGVDTKQCRCPGHRHSRHLAPTGSTTEPLCRRSNRQHSFCLIFSVLCLNSIQIHNT